MQLPATQIYGLYTYVETCVNARGGTKFGTFSHTLIFVSNLLVQVSS